MQITLKERLDQLEQTKQLRKEGILEVSEEEIRNAKSRILINFYEKNQLAHDVSQGRDSYVSRIAPITEKYSGFWGRVKRPARDAQFDEEVIKVLDSMNNVGVYGNTNSLNQEVYTTQGRRRLLKKENLIGLAVGSMFSGASVAALALSPGSPPLPIYFGAAILIPLPLFINKMLDGFKYEIIGLATYANESQEFLRENKI